MSVIWESPVPRKYVPNTSTVLNDEARELRAHPHEWAVIRDYDNQRAANVFAWAVRKGQRAVFRPAGSFEATTRTVNGVTRVYARYVGGEQS
jgi:hypothetical protein